MADASISRSEVYLRMSRTSGEEILYPAQCLQMSGLHIILRSPSPRLQVLRHQLSIGNIFVLCDISDIQDVY